MAEKMERETELPQYESKAVDTAALQSKLDRFRSPHLDASNVFDRKVESVEPLYPGEHANEVFRLRLGDGTSAVYKPVSGENEDLRRSIPLGGMSSREVAASVLDRHLRSGLVPETRSWAGGPRGEGSVQRWVDNTSAGKLDINEYSAEEVQRMAVLDYISANTDRWEANYRTSENGRLVAIDHGCSFPEGDDDAIRSDFVCVQLGRQLSDSVLSDVDGVDSDALTKDLCRTGLSESAANQARERLLEIKRAGQITGESWSGKICDADWHTWRDVRP